MKSKCKLEKMVVTKTKSKFKQEKVISDKNIAKVKMCKTGSLNHYVYSQMKSAQLDITHLAQMNLS